MFGSRRSLAKHFTQQQRKRRSFRPSVEGLEDRSVPAYNVLSVTGSALNNVGQIIGNSAIYNDGVPADITPPGGGTVTSRALNEAGQVAGSVRTTSDRAFIWDPSLGMTDLGTSSTSVANGINDSSQVAGTIGYEQPGTAARAFLWDSAGGLRDLGTFGGTSAIARDINNAGKVIGWREIFTTSDMGNSVNHLGYIYDSTTGAVTHLGSPWSSSSRALDINNAGQVVGITGAFSGPSGASWFSQRTFLWQNGVTTDLGITPAHSGGTLAINDLGQVISGKYLWENGVVTDVNNLVNLPAGWTITQINDINNAGMMIGTATQTVGTTVYSESIMLVPDTHPTFGISDVRVTELDGQTTAAVFTVTRTGPLDQSLTVDYTTMDGISFPAIAGQDYLATSGALSFNPGEASKTIRVTILDDTLDEQGEWLNVRLSPTPGNYVADVLGACWIGDNDDPPPPPPPPSLSINDVTIVEGKSGVRYAVFTVTLSAASASSISVSFATANGTAKTSDNDYVATSGTLTFAAGETTKTIMVAIKGDRKKEANETFFVNLSGVLGALLADSQGVGTILNDD